VFITVHKVMEVIMVHGPFIQSAMCLKSAQSKGVIVVHVHLILSASVHLITADIGYAFMTVHKVT
jgi:hypothetical protein